MSKDAKDMTNTQLNGYAVGLLLAEDLKSKGFDELADAEFIMHAIRDVWTKGKTVISQEQAGQIYSQLVHKHKGQKSAKNREAGEAYMRENAKKDGVVQLPSGLQYEVLRKGKGAVPSPEDQVKVHYEGKLLDGKVFDSSYMRQAPTTFGVTQVIQGWQEILQLMQEGEKRTVYIPSHLAYGEQGAGDMIPPGSTLIFDVELLEVLD